MTIREQFDACEVKDHSQIILVNLNDWIDALNAAVVPESPKHRRMLEDLKKGAAGAVGEKTVGVHADQVKLVLEWAEAKLSA